MDYEIGCTLAYEAQAPTSFAFNVEAARHPGQVVTAETLTLVPERPVERWIMPESGNRYLRIDVEPGPFTLDYRAEVTLRPILEDPATVAEIPAQALPLSVLTHLWPSRYCQSDRLSRLAQRSFGEAAPAYARVNAICNWIHDNVDYVGGISDEMTSAFDTATQRAGVCRDFAHLAIALCRALGIPARYVSAYAHRLSPPDFHAVIEAFLDGPSGFGWYLFDPTRKAAPDGLVRIGLGRDAAEVAFASPFGDVSFEKPKVWITARSDAASALTTQAVRAEP